MGLCLEKLDHFPHTVLHGLLKVDILRAHGMGYGAEVKHRYRRKGERESVPK